MIKMKSIFTKCLGIFVRNEYAFCNIAEGTHAGNITMIAAETIDNANLVVKAGALANEILIAGSNDKPIGVCNDQGASGEPLNMTLPGCAESTIICVCAVNVNAGDSLYTAAGGKVSKLVGDGSYKIGVALTNANAGCVVEVDPQGFGERAWQVYACGLHTWTGSANNETLDVIGLQSTDIVVASIQASSSGVTSVKSTPSTGSVTFTLNAAGSASNEKIAWMALRKN